MFTDPTKNLRMFGLREDSVVADLGAGTGFYSLAAARMVPKGKVYAIEIAKDFLGTIKQKAKEANIGNVEIIWGDIEKLGGTHIGDGIVDAVIASNVLFQVKDKDKFVSEIKRILKQKGKVLLVDWSEVSALSGKHIFPKSRAREIFEKSDFAVDREIDAGEHHYGMILIKS